MQDKAKNHVGKFYTLKKIGDRPRFFLGEKSGSVPCFYAYSGVALSSTRASNAGVLLVENLPNHLS